MNNWRRLGVGMSCAALVFGLGLSSPLAQEAPKPDTPTKETEPEVRLPTTDPKSEEMLRDAWAKVESFAGQAKDPLTRFASKATTKVDTTKVTIPRWGDFDLKAMIDAIQLDSNIAWTAGNHMSMHVHDGPATPAPEGDAGGRGRGGWGAGGGIRMAMVGANTRIGHVLHYVIGFQRFDEVFKDASFEPAELEDKALRGVRVWRNVLGKAISHTYVIDRKGKGMITAVHRDGKVWEYEYAKGRRQQKISKLTIRPDETKEEREAREKKEAEEREARRERDAAGGGQGGPPGGGGGRGGRGGGGPGGRGGGGASSGPDIPSGHEVFGFDGKKSVGGYEIWTQVTTWFEFQGRHYPLVMTLSDTTVNKAATDEQIRAGGFGESQGFPPPTRKDGSGGDGDKKSEKDKE